MTDVASRLLFLKKLQAVTNRVHATSNVDQIMLELSQDICKLFRADRIKPVDLLRNIKRDYVDANAWLPLEEMVEGLLVLTFDPDVIMVGEMRDPETTGIGIEASLTGHLVFATLDTNSAPESIIRLLDMGMDPFNFSDALLGILVQRLGKRLCKDCKEAYQPDAGEIEALLQECCAELAHADAWKKDPEAAFERDSAGVAQSLRQGWTVHALSRLRLPGVQRYRLAGARRSARMAGRQRCHGKIIQEKARVADILACALNEGMRTLKMDGIDEIMQGITDSKQVRAVCIK
ncbi:ATPase, T2SS/T4P/T4SS family [Quatrionicoccus australiensis]|uniref:ATPase, T2SS/T4P/T4SS family n=1 Tax=Quatrionicoccus australiensis TaxID=138118 RepID=UPI001CFBD8CC|nr:ATPase, T2SS/T4P/T4SS family [Quatrionicoccus australiensis]